MNPNCVHYWLQLELVQALNDFCQTLGMLSPSGNNYYLSAQRIEFTAAEAPSRHCQPG